MAIKVFKFGLLDPVDGWGDAVLDILYKRNHLWNNLVSLERRYREDYRQLIMASNSELAIAQARIDAIQLELESLGPSRRKKNAMAGENISADSQDVSLRKALLEESAILRESTKKLRQLAKVEIKPRAIELENSRFHAVKRLVKESGLWWCNSNDVVQSYEIGRSRAMRENGQLNFRAFDGTGKFEVRQSGGFQVENVLAGKCTYAKIIEVSDTGALQVSARSARSRARHDLVMAVEATPTENEPRKRRMVTWPIIMHRDLPTDGLIKYVDVLRKRVGSRFVWSCSITLEVDAEAAPLPLSTHFPCASCGIDLGFRQFNSELRVATLADCDGKFKHYMLDVKALNHADKIESTLDSAAYDVWSKLRPIISELSSYPENLRERLIGMLKSGAKAPTRSMRTLHNKLLEDPSLIPDALPILEAWLGETRLLFKEMYDLRAKALNRRRDQYRKIAREVASTYALVRISDMSLKDMSKTQRDDGTSSRLVPMARKNRFRSALSELTLFIKQACEKSGSTFEKIKSSYMTRCCNTCGHINSVDDGTLIMITCDACGEIADRDQNAALNLLNGEITLEKPKTYTIQSTLDLAG